MTTSTPQLLPGVDVHNGAYRVRLRFGGRRFTKAGIATADEANALALQWRKLRDAGLTPDQSPEEQTLRQAAEALLIHKRTTVSRRTKRKLKKVEDWEAKTRPWREGPFANVPLSLLRRMPIEDAILARAAEVAKTAGDELDGLKATLRYAGERGQTFDRAILAIERPTSTPRKRMALTVAELELLAASAPEYARRMILFGGTVGCRPGELHSLLDDCVDLDGRAIFVPAHLNKEHEDKWIDLTREETQLLREQLMARAPGTRLVFPKSQGGQWQHNSFGKLVWMKSIRRAAQTWLDDAGLPATAPTPFGRFVFDSTGEPEYEYPQGPNGIKLQRMEGALTPHDLRSTAATLMRDAGFSREQAASRLGHADTGQLLDRIYDQGDRRARMQKAIEAFAPVGLRAEPEPQPSTSPAAAGSAGATLTPVGSQVGPKP